jgi:hypothetical protein
MQFVRDRIASRFGLVERASVQPRYIVEPIVFRPCRKVPIGSVDRLPKDGTNLARKSALASPKLRMAVGNFLPDFRVLRLALGSTLSLCVED